jgi:hypothetical protein
MLCRSSNQSFPANLSCGFDSTALPAQEKIPDALKDTVKRQLILRRPLVFPMFPLVREKTARSSSSKSCTVCWGLLPSE